MKSITLKEISDETFSKLNKAYHKAKAENPVLTKVEFTVNYLDKKLTEDEKANEGPY